MTATSRPRAADGPGTAAPSVPAPSRLRRGWDLAGWRLLPGAVLAALGGLVVARRWGLWYDELYTAEVATLPVGELVRAFVTGEGTIPYLRDAPPSYNGPYYLVAHLWLAATRLPADEVGLRLLSLVAAVAAVVVLTGAVARLAGRRTAVVAGLVVAANPFVVEYAAEARGYGLALLATAAAAGAVAAGLEGRRRAPLALAGATALAGLAHWFALLAVAGLVAGAVVLRGRRAAPLVVAAAVGSLPAAAVVGVALANGVAGSGAEWIRDEGLEVPWDLLLSWAAGAPALVALTLGCGAWALVAGARDRRAGGPGAGRGAATVAAAWVGVPVVLVLLLQLARPVYVNRYLLPAVLGLGVLVALGATRLPGRWWAVASTAVVVTSALVALGGLGLGPKEDVRGAVDLVAARHRPGEPVVAAGRWDALGLDHHARRDHPALVPDVVLPPDAPPDAGVVWVVRRATGGVKGDPGKTDGLEADLVARGLRLVATDRFDGRYADTLVERWAR